MPFTFWYNNVKEQNSKVRGERIRRQGCAFSFLYPNFSMVIIDSLKSIFLCKVFVGMSDRIQIINESAHYHFTKPPTIALVIVLQDVRTLDFI